MRKEREALLVATLAGLVIVSAAAFVVQPTMARNDAGDRLVQLSRTYATPAPPLSTGDNA